MYTMLSQFLSILSHHEICRWHTLWTDHVFLGRAVGGVKSYCHTEKVFWTHQCPIGSPLGANFAALRYHLVSGVNRIKRSAALDAATFSFQ